MEIDRRLRQLVDLLREHGLSEYVDLPEIAVMGDTSSGKSSVLTALSGIQFPSSADITTRCPTRLYMSRASNGETRVEIGITWHKDSSYKPKKSQDDFKTCVIQNLDLASNEITQAIQSAQEFIIERSEKEVAFDVIEVKIESAGATDLTLTDLPGIVRFHGKDESKTIVAEIDSLINSYLNNERCIILAVHPANVDFHNSQIMAEARKVDPSTKRTIPVITKPDLVDKGAENAVIDLLLGNRTENFQMGFHIVKCRGQVALDKNVSLSESLEEEERFFRDTVPWNGIQDRSLIGINSLKKKLGDLQNHILHDSIHSIREEVQKKLVIAREDLKAMGEDMQDNYARRTMLSQVVDILIRDIDANLMATRYANWKTQDDCKLIANINKLFKEFSSNILKSKLVNISDGTALVKGSRVLVTIEGRDYDGIIHDIVRPGQATTRYHINPVSEADRKIFSTLSQYVEFPLNQIRNNDNYWLLALMQTNSGRELPNFLNYELFATITNSMIEEEWKPLFDKLVTDVHDILKEYLKDAVHNLHVKPLLRTWIMETLLSVLSDIVSDVRVCLDSICESELEPSTYNHYIFELVNKSRLDPTIEQLKAAASGQTINLSAALAILERNQKMSCEQHMLREMELVLSAYGKVAGKRFMDQITSAIKVHFLNQITKRFRRELEKCTDERLLTLCQESVLEAEKRGKCKLAVVRLGKAMDALSEYFGL